MRERDKYSQLYGYDTEPLYCTECKEVHLGKEWEDTRSPCEDCGDHPAIRCPCGERYDMIYWDIDVDFAPPQPIKGITQDDR